VGPFISKRPLKKQATTNQSSLDQGVYSALWFPSAVKR
jgi:hypothetical protein